MKLELAKVLHTLGAMSDLSSEISSGGDFEDVTRASLHTLLGTLAIPKGAIAVSSSRPRQLKIVAAKGLNGVVGLRIPIGRDEEERFKSQVRPIHLVGERNRLSQFVRRNGAAMKQLHAHLAMPMIARGEMMGAVFLSRKFSGDGFTEQDLDIVTTISRHVAVAFYNHRLLISLKRKVTENRRLYGQMRQIYYDTVRAFGAAIDLKDAYTSGHSERVAKYAKSIAREMGVTGAALEHIGVAGYLHDIGKIVVDRAIINNPRPLTEREYVELNRHVTIGYEILSHIRQPWQEIAYMTKCHHEKVDGTGYPQGLRGSEIPLGSKVVTLADSFDAMMTDRPYRSRLPLDRALDEMRRHTGTQFAPEVVTAFCRVLLCEIKGEARERVLLPMIGIRFDRAAILDTLNAIVDEFASGRRARAAH
jgi:putative nucleotidyltransferase with HDIG domain